MSRDVQNDLECGVPDMCWTPGPELTTSCTNMCWTGSHPTGPCFFYGATRCENGWLVEMVTNLCCLSAARTVPRIEI